MIEPTQPGWTRYDIALGRKPPEPVRLSFDQEVIMTLRAAAMAVDPEPTGLYSNADSAGYYADSAGYSGSDNKFSAHSWRAQQERVPKFCKGKR